MSIIDALRPTPFAILPPSKVLALKSADREQDQADWLRSARSFPSRVWTQQTEVPFPVIVIAEDVVEPGRGFGVHGHADMEILSYVVSGALEHADSAGRHQVLRPGQFQLMSAGTGVRHSEYNASSVSPVHFLQIWIAPYRMGLKPDYTHAVFDTDAPLTLLAGPTGALAVINQDIAVWRVAPKASAEVVLPLAPGTRTWAHVVQGRAQINETSASSGDGLSITNTPFLTVTSEDDATEILVFVV